MMKSKVFFVRIADSDDTQTRKDKFARLLDRSRLLEGIDKNDPVIVKLHFGEEGNTGHVKPDFIKILVEHLAQKGSKAVLSDSNALYRGKRTFTKDHVKLAAEHGFTKSACGAPVMIAEGEDGTDVTDVRIDRKYVKVAKIASLFSGPGAIIGVSHFKGHLLTGFGGSIKNIGMGCASRTGKLAQHSDVAPVIDQGVCTGCGVCAEACPAGAISIPDMKAAIDNKKCIGCAECIASCSYNAISVDWSSGAGLLQERMAEYALAALRGKEGRSIFINFAVNISRECDCWTTDYPRISPDVGIFISRDIVSVDKASLDTVTGICGRDVFREAHPDIDGSKQLVHAEKIGLGSTQYELIDVV